MSGTEIINSPGVHDGSWNYEVRLDVFNGPLDLLLYLIKKNEIDIYDIPITVITAQYIEHLEKLKSLNLDLAGEYLILAATLIHIKSRMLLPHDVVPEEESSEDPRAELVAQLIEYQVFKEKSLELDRLPRLDRDVFKREFDPHDDHLGAADIDSLEVDLFDLLDAFRKIAATWDGIDKMQINREKISLTDKMNDILSHLLERDGLTMEEILVTGGSRRQLLYTFLALLELAKMRLIKLYQGDSFGRIRIFSSIH